MEQSDLASDVPSLRDILAARRPVAQNLGRTMLNQYPGLSSLVGAEVWVKHENHHSVGAFKVRGGVSLAATLSDAERARGLYTASTGNHGQSIAYAGKITGTRVKVGVPEVANPDKIAAMRALGAEVIQRGPDFDAAREWVAESAREEGARFVAPTEPELIAGVGVYALEILEDLPEVDTIIVPIGSGSGATAVSLVARSANPRIRLIGVQAEKAPAAYLSWKEGRPVEARMETCAEGVATRVPFENTQRILRDSRFGLDDFVLVSEEAMEQAIVWMLRHTHNVAEHAGAAPLAAALAIRDRLAGQKVVLVQSGGNITAEALGDILQRHASLASD